MVNTKRMFELTPCTKTRVEYEVFRMAELEEYLGASACRVEVLEMGSRTSAYDPEYEGYRPFDTKADYVLVDDEGNLYSAYEGEVKGLTPVNKDEARVKVPDLEAKIRGLIDCLDPVELACFLDDDCFLRAYAVERAEFVNFAEYKHFKGAHGRPFDDAALYVQTFPKTKTVVSLCFEDLAELVRENPAPIVVSCVNNYRYTGTLSRHLTRAALRLYIEG